MHMLSWITDMELVQTGAGLRLYTATRAGGGVLALGVGAAGLSLLDVVATPSGATLPAPAQLDICTLNGQEVLLVTGANSSRLGGFGLEPDGSLGAAAQVIGSPSGTIAAQIMVQVAGQTYCYMNKLGDAGVLSYQVQPNGSMVFLDNLLAQGGFQGVDIAAFSSVKIGGAQYLLALSNGQDAVRSYRIAADGGLTQVASLGAAGGLGLAAPSALEVVQLAGVTYALVAGAGSSSISVVQIGSNGSLGLTDHVVDTLDTRFQGVEALASVTIGDRVFVIAGGGDDGVTLFTLLPNGRLLQLAQQLQVPGMALHAISELTATVIDGKIELFVAGQGLGITQLRVDVGDLAAMTLGSDGVDTLTGGDGHDLLAGRADDDVLYGGAGDDILMDGAGVDMMFGGAGADIFVLSGDGHEDTIRDFQVGIDRLDLSAWGRVYSTDALSFRNYPFGAIINFGAERLVIQASNNQRIPYSSFLASDLFGLWHVVAEPVVAGVRVEGSPRQDVLTGDLGDDTLAGGGGADLIDGRAGFDTVDFSGTTAALVIDLVNPLRNGGAAAGDVYTSIEGVIGGAGNDMISGGLGANMLGGAAGNDFIAGRGGDDTLAGGSGNDLLEGGSGEDQLFGGEGRDRASYAFALSAVRADLHFSYTNTGEARGDSYDNIEDLSGGGFADILAGNAESNAILGRAGNDRIYGRSGNDSLFGGDGADTLRADAGDDRVDGGAGWDTAVFDGPTAMRINLTLPGAQATGQGSDTLTSIEHVTTGAGADRLWGNAFANSLNAGAGNDTLEGGAGNDKLTGGLGNDILIGGDGLDWVLFEGASAANVNLTLQGTQITGHGFDLIRGVENVSGGAGQDRLIGTSGGNAMLGNDGDDHLWGLAGDDTLVGGAGADRLAGDLGNDVLYGGYGIDTAHYSGSGAVVIDLALTRAQNTLRGIDLLIGVENLVSGSGADRLSGNALANVLVASDGADWLRGGSGNDLLLGDAGNDTLSGDNGNDVLRGGSGVDLAIYAGSVAVRVNLALLGYQNTGQGLDRLTEIENLWSGSGHDRLFGNAAANTVWAGAGNDTLAGGAGNDRLDGGTGADWLFGGSGADGFVFKSGRDHVGDFNRATGDRIYLEDAVLRAVHGLTGGQVVAKFGHDLGATVQLDFGAGQTLTLDGVPSLAGLAQALFVI